jgi:hypothetical protein
MTVQAEERLFDAEMLKEEPAVSSVLGGNQVSRLEDFNRPQSNVLTISDGCGNDA